eukprot:296127_1
MSDWAKVQTKLQKNYDDIYNEYKPEPGLDKQASTAKYDELFNARSQVDLLEREGEYGFDFNVVEGERPTAPIKSTSPLLNNDGLAAGTMPGGAGGSSSEFDGIEGMVDELHIIYKKFMLCTVLIVVLCAATFIGGIWDDFYNWNGITFNAFVVIVGLYGILIHICCADGGYTITKRRKLKHLLIYFVIAFLCILTVFVVAMIYAVLVPLRVAQEDDYSDGIIAGVAIFGVFGVVFWTIFVLFYIDICARACLKRGRIDFIIVEMDSVFWNRLYRFVIWFRLRFRTLRRVLTAMTGIHCIRGKLKLSAVRDADKLHEEQRALAILEHDEYTMCGCERCEINLEDRFSQITNFCVKCLCCPCLMCEAIWTEINPCVVVSGLVFVGVFAPLAMYTLLVLVVGLPCIMAGNGVFQSWYGLAMLLAVPLLYLVWYSPFGICPHNLFNTDEFPKEWNWTAQCIVWDYASLILLYILEAVGDSN